MTPQQIDVTNDREYWTDFYNNYSNLQCSDFCKFVLDFFKERLITNVLDAGCGTGRDSYKLSERYTVTGVDSSGYKPVWQPQCQFYTDDFCTHDKKKYDLIYSRFTFHSITNEQHATFLKSMKPNQWLAIECRSDWDKDEEKVHGEGHYRNYVNLVYLLDLIREHGFTLKYCRHAKGLAPYKTEDPMCIRLVAIKDLDVRQL